MHILRQHGRKLLVVVMVCLICPCVGGRRDETTLSKDQIKPFLLTAKVVGSKQTGKGVTSTWRLTLWDGTMTHDASFQAVNEDKPMQLASGHRNRLHGFLPIQHRSLH